ncbi:MAG: hypothetical protein R2825_11880 [Saprospiraceae bacterium]
MKITSFSLIGVLFLLYFVFLKNTVLTAQAADHRYLVAKKVFDDLVEAKGVKNMSVPQFRLVQSERNVAWSKLQEAEIGLEAKAYEICRSFGKDSLNALAAILSHELTHYYEKHGWTELFANDNPELASAQSLVSTQEHWSQEMEADYLGGFLAYAAGYPSLQIMPKFLTKVYQSYGFDHNLAGYPTLEQRQLAAEESLKKGEQLADIYDMANYLTAIGKYETAKIYYEYILKNFQSRELYNNLGVVALSAAICYSPNITTNYAYPFELDAASRLQHAQRGGDGDFLAQKEKRERLLQEAIQHFKTAVLLDESYAPGYLNLGCAYALLNVTGEAEYFAHKAKKYAETSRNERAISDVLILLGIIAAQENEPTKAHEYFDQALLTGNGLAALNKELLNGYAVSAKVVPMQTGDLSKAGQVSIEGVSLNKMAVQLEREELQPTYLLEINRETVFGVVQMEHSKVLIHSMPFSGKYFFVQLTGENYQGTCGNGLGSGSHKDAIVEEFHEPERQVRLVQGSVLVYPKQQLVFQLNTDKKLTGWGVFKEKN